MKTIETVATVTPDGKLSIELVSDLPPDHYNVVVIIDEAPSVAATGSTVDTPKTAWDVLREHAGTVSAPEDWSIEHDHYLYGTPKRDAPEQ
ncbi:MAG: hypothetical protein AAFQ89_14850 [Cyanobacteria bacterium J06626_18]